MGIARSLIERNQDNEDHDDTEKQKETKKYPVVPLDRTTSQLRYCEQNYILTYNRKSTDPQDGFASNKLKTSRYTPWNFLPKNLFEQFRRLSNVYFTLIVIISFIPQISPISPWTGLGGLIFVLVATAINEGYLDYVCATNLFLTFVRKDTKMTRK
jgi:hypothetical protein